MEDGRRATGSSAGVLEVSFDDDIDGELYCSNKLVGNSFVLKAT